MSEPSNLKPLLESILNIKIAQIHYPERQKVIDVTYDAKGVRLDVYCEDNKNTVYSIEMQVTDQRNLRTVNRLINLIELKLRKTSWAAIAASEWNTNFSQLLPWVWESYDTAKDKYTSFEKDYLMAYFNSVWWWKKWYKYEALFSPNSPYYKVYNPSKTSLTSSQSNKGTWSLWGVNNTQINDYDDLYYYMWI